MNILHRAVRWVSAVVLAACVSPSASATAAPAGQLPLGYRISTGNYPWTGRLHALAFRTAALSSSPVQMPWEAGQQLDRQDIHARRLYLGGSQLVPFRWAALDDDARATLDAVAPTGNGTARLAWLRGDLGNAGLRTRDTRLGNSAGARVHVVAPPIWLPMQPGHTDFRVRHARRPTVVWLGTRDGLLHGFDALTGLERGGYLPRAALPEAAALTEPAGRVPSAPCPRPVSVDADPSGVWRTLLLCGMPMRRSPAGNETGNEMGSETGSETPNQRGAVFVLDVSTPDAATPLQLLWEVQGSDTLPLSGSGPIHTAMWTERGKRRWAAAAILAPTAATQARAALALLSLDRPPERWAATANVPRIVLPDTGCDATTASVPLLAVTIRSIASGAAHTAYATDAAGRLWRFGLGHLSTGAAAPTPVCMHRQRGASGANVEAPVVVQTGHGPLIVYGTGSEVSAIPDRPGVKDAPGRIDIRTQGDGVVLSPAQSGGRPAGQGWTLTLPRPGERVETLYLASPVHLGFTTVDAIGQLRSYLVDADSGASVTIPDDAGRPVPATTGLTWAGGTGAPIGVTSTVASGGAPAAGRSSRDTFGLGIWHVDGDTATLLQRAQWHRRRGRLGWRELVRSPQ